MGIQQSWQGGPARWVSVCSFHFCILSFHFRFSGDALRFQRLQKQHRRYVEMIAAFECRHDSTEPQFKETL